MLAIVTLVVHASDKQFKNYNADNGLYSSEVFHVIQDSKGYIWFATNQGVSKFDGYTFQHFTQMLQITFSWAFMGKMSLN